MAGPIALLGSGEFLPVTESIDRALVDFDTGPTVAILPTAAGEEGDESVERWLQMGADHIRRLGGVPRPLPVVDRASAESADHADAVAGADYITFSGGDPLYVVETLRGSAVWDATLSAWSRGAALAGCSAGAMMMGSVTASPRSGTVVPGLRLFRRLCVIPHFDFFERSRPGMASRIVEETPPETVVIGLDEDTALLYDGAACSARGRQQVWVFDGGEWESYGGGESVPLDLGAIAPR